MAFRSSALNITETANGACSYKNTDSSRVNLFYKSCRGVSKEELVLLLEKSWEEDVLDTLKLIAYTRDIRGGKGERNIFREMLVWLASVHPEELKLNIDCFIKEYGRYDDIFVLCKVKEMEDFCINFCVEQFKADLMNIDTENKSVSLLAKWFPSENKKLDKEYKIYKRICKKLCLTPKQFRTNYLVPLRRKIDILETKMCEKKWENIEFSKVCGSAMKIHSRPTKAFERNVPEKFEEYKTKLTSGTTSVNGKTLFPHEIVKEYLNARHMDVILEKQWEEIIKGTTDSDSNTGMKDCLVLSDVSSSMSGTPMIVSIAMGILISSKSSEKWRDLVLTFESNPHFHNVKGDTLFEKVKCLQKAPWGGSTDFCKALDLILTVGLNKRLSQSEMPKKLIVISDMQFNEADKKYMTNYQYIQKRYQESGYILPTIVFWNVNGQFNDIPVDSSNQQGVSLISGFSASLIKSISNGEIPTPFTTMRAAIDVERYSLVKVL